MELDVAIATEKLVLVDDVNALAGAEEPTFSTLFDLAIQKAKCIVTDRDLMVSRPTYMESTGNVVTLDVMTDMVSGQTRKICQLIVPKDALTRALSQPPVPDQDAADDETVN